MFQVIDSSTANSECHLKEGLADVELMLFVLIGWEIVNIRISEAIWLVQISVKLLKFVPDFRNSIIKEC